MKPLYSRIPSKISALHARAPYSDDIKPVLSSVKRITGSLDYARLINSWTCRTIDVKQFDFWQNGAFLPQPGDVALFKVEKVGEYDHLIDADQLKLKIEKDDFFVGVFGNRYDINGYEGIVAGSDVLHLLSPSGIVWHTRQQARPYWLPNGGFAGWVPHNTRRIEDQLT